METNNCDCTECRWKYACFPCMDDYEISKQKCTCSGNDYEKEE